MNREQANKLLDRVRDGENYSHEQISAALFATGDIHARVRSQRVDTPLSGQSQPNGWPDGPTLVGGDQSAHRQNSWAGWSRYLDCRDVQATQ